uniref:Serpin family B member 8 n=1 Tax=Leptobrachium leishanense TaxID=445787 RepID=A0A8C5MQD6_9ANUR
MDISDANNQFALDVLREIGNELVGQNVVFAPLSILMTMIMVYSGAGGNTAAQMGKVLHVNNIKNVNPKCKNVLVELFQSNPDYKLRNMNKLFGEKTYQFLPSYLGALNASYGAVLEKVDFLNDTERTRQYINEWITNQTDGKIKELLPKKSVSSNTALAVVNVLYFLANWTKQFDGKTTKKGSFKLITGEEVNVDMMFTANKFNFNYISNPGLSIIELPYGKTQGLSMFVLLPNNNTVLKKLDLQISYKDIANWVSETNMKPVNVALHLPKFRIEQSIPLRNILSSMGMSDPFDPLRANFTQMTDRDNLFVSDVHHKTFIEVNERGTEAASATAAVITSRSSLREQFNADHPFHFFIREKKTQCILIYGKVYKP